MSRATFVPEYWLCHSEGFAVVSPEGRLGYVDEVRFASGIDRPDAIAFRRTDGHDLVVVPFRTSIGSSRSARRSGCGGGAVHSLEILLSRRITLLRPA